MNCDDVRSLLEAHLDGELDLVRHLEIETHLSACPRCAAVAKDLAARQVAVQESLPRLVAPPQLRKRVLASIRAESAPWQRRPIRAGCLAGSPEFGRYRSLACRGAAARLRLGQCPCAR